MTIDHRTSTTTTPTDAAERTRGDREDTARHAASPDAGAGISRRVVSLGGIGMAAVTVGLAACSSPAPAAEASKSPSPSDGGSEDSSASGADAPIVALADVPVGGAVAVDVDGAPYVVAQPKAGSVVAFTAICTHQGCKVAPAGAQLDCPCHGSQFDAFTGEVLHGPAEAPLTALAVAVEGDNVVKA
jgi:Rieske Fe-S protein